MSLQNKIVMEVSVSKESLSFINGFMEKSNGDQVTLDGKVYEPGTLVFETLQAGYDLAKKQYVGKAIFRRGGQALNGTAEFLQLLSEISMT